MVIQAGGHSITVTRRGYPDTPETFSDGGFVVLAHTSGETGRTYTTAHTKADFDRDADACVAVHLQRCGIEAV